MTSPIPTYRDAPMVVHEADPPGRRWKVHSHANPIGQDAGGSRVQTCRWCGIGAAPRRALRCFGRRAFWFGRLLCPRRAHHHVVCVYCGRDWLEATCDDAPETK